MQGHIFIAFTDMVIDKYGIEMLDTIIQESNPASGAAYTVGARYDDREIYALADSLCKHTGLPLTDLVKAFGHYLFGYLYKASKADQNECPDYRHFLMGINDIVHAEVARLYPDTNLPQFTIKDQDKTLVLEYRSQRKLCQLCEGLIEGGAAFFSEKITLTHPVCIHKGADHCELSIEFH